MALNNSQCLKCLHIFSRPSGLKRHLERKIPCTVGLTLGLAGPGRVESLKTDPNIDPETDPNIDPEIDPEIDVLDEIINDMGDNLKQLVPVTVPDTVPVKVPVTVPVKVPVTVPVKVPVKVPDTVPVKVPDTVPDTVPEVPVKVSAVPVKVPVKVPAVPVKVPEVPIKVPEVPIKVPEVPINVPEVPVNVPIKVPAVQVPIKSPTILVDPAARPGPARPRPIWANEAPICLTDVEVQGLFVSPALSAYCARSPTERVNEKTSLSITSTVIINLIKLAHKDTSAQNVYVDRSLNTFVLAFGPKNDAVWLPISYEIIIDSLVNGVAAELWRMLSSNSQFTASVRCAASCVVLSVRHGSLEWNAQLRLHMRTTLANHLQELQPPPGLIITPTHRATVQNLQANMSANLPANVPANMPANLPVLPVQKIVISKPIYGFVITPVMASQLFIKRSAISKGIDPKRFADLLFNDAVALDPNYDLKFEKDLRYRLEQKLWEAEDAGHFIHNNVEDLSTIRRILVQN